MLYIQDPKIRQVFTVYDDLTTRILTLMDSLSKTKDLPLKDKTRLISTVPYIAEELTFNKNVQNICLSEKGFGRKS